MKSKIVTVSLAIAFAIAIVLVYVSMEQAKTAMSIYDNLFEDYAEVKTNQSYALDEANEEGYEAGFKTGWIEAMNAKLSTFHNITLEADGKTISFIDELGERYTWEIDNDLS